MKLIATRDFAIVPKLEKYISCKNEKNCAQKANPGLGKFQHHRLVHLGFQFEIGDEKSIAEMVKNQNTEAAELIAILSYAKCIGDANNQEVVDYVKDEIATAERRAAKMEESNRLASGQGATEALMALIQKLNPATAK
jgi:hypothetical protein